MTLQTPTIRWGIRGVGMAVALALLTGCGGGGSTTPRLSEPARPVARVPGVQAPTESAREQRAQFEAERVPGAGSSRMLSFRGELSAKLGGSMMGSHTRPLSHPVTTAHVMIHFATFDGMLAYRVALQASPSDLRAWGRGVSEPHLRMSLHLREWKRSTSFVAPMFDRQDLGDGFAATDWTLCPGCFEGYEEAMDGNAEGIAELVESAQRVEGLAETGLPVLRILAPWDGREKARDLAVGLDAVQAFSARMAARTSAYREGESRASDANAAYVAFFEDEVHPRTLGGTFEAARCGALLQGYPDLANLGMWEDFVVRQRRAIDCYLDAAEGYDFAAYERARPGLEARAERLEAATFGIDAQTVPTNRQQAMRFEFALEQAADRLGNGLDKIAAIERRGKERRAAARSRERMFSRLAQDWNRDLATIGRMGSNAFSNGPLTTFDAMERRVQQDRERERLEAQAARAQAQAEAARNANVRSEQRARDRGETVAADEEVYLAVVSGQMPSRCNPFNVVAPGEPEPNCSWAGPVYAVFELGTANSACEGMRDGNAEAWERDAFRILRVSGLTARAEDRLRDLVKESDNQPFAATDGAVTARSEATAVWEGKGSPRERGLRTYYGDLTGMTAAVRATGCAGVTLIDR